MALVSLREAALGGVDGACIGILALGSNDENRFFKEMGTLYLQRIVELASAGLMRFA